MVVVGLVLTGGNSNCAPPLPKQKKAFACALSDNEHDMSSLRLGILAGIIGGSRKMVWGTPKILEKFFRSVGIRFWNACDFRSSFGVGCGRGPFEVVLEWGAGGPLGETEVR